ncbi:uncharacterized protein JN550_005509 [Neoarthrinium moseri]|uniref:uncharacterized protein n=1 Tax=Neoarthrinium moseri TaxID=1658444 RepID=UPI001FDE9BFD|nr:uncharacterized protein JN550_005509 [Neoarthrinium moseri]KAI1869919.1 hypothetical protein JN550_005509 [Neoarthrinium moseri]
MTGVRSSYLSGLLDRFQKLATVVEPGNSNDGAQCLPQTTILIFIILYSLGLSLAKSCLGLPAPFTAPLFTVRGRITPRRSPLSVPTCKSSSAFAIFPTT